MRSKIYPYEDTREWCDWEARYRDDLDELRWQEQERRRLQNSDRACGYVEPEEGECDDN